MTAKSVLATCAIAALLPLSACNVAEKEPAADASPATGGVVRTDMAATEAENAGPVQPMTEMAVIQSQPGPEGSQVDLLKVAVTGDVLTVTMRCSSAEKINSESFRIADISIIDDATSQRAAVLRDSSGAALVSDYSKGSGPDNDWLGAECETKPGVIWAKFPAPPATSKTVSINFPKVAPFDGVPIAR